MTRHDYAYLTATRKWQVPRWIIEMAGGLVFITTLATAYSLVHLIEVMP